VGLYNLGNGLYGQGKYESAINYYTAALALEPDDADAKECLAAALEARAAGAV